MSIKPIEAQVVCARDALLQDFEVELIQQGFKPSTVVRKKKLFADLNDWLQVHEPIFLSYPYIGRRKRRLHAG